MVHFFIMPLLNWLKSHWDKAGILFVALFIGGILWSNSHYQAQVEEQSRIITQLNDRVGRRDAKIDEMHQSINHWREISDKLLTQEQSMRSATDDDLQEIKAMLKNTQCSREPLPHGTADKLRK